MRRSGSGRKHPEGGRGAPPLVIAHRGASGYLPEHTLEAYGLAIEQGADVIEPDLVFSRDGVLVARHDRYLSTTTDIGDHAEFAGRKRVNDDAADAAANLGREDWWVEDFTLAELKTLRARQPFPGRSTQFDGLYEIPTFADILALAACKSKQTGRPLGVYPETKHPAFFAAIGHDFEAPLLKALHGFDAGPVFIQSFEPEILKRLNGKTGALLVQLVLEQTPGAGPNIPLREIAAYADVVGAAKQLIIAADGRTTTFVGDAHNRGLGVHAWTFRNDQPNSAINRLHERSKNPAPHPAGAFAAVTREDGETSGAPDQAARELLAFFSEGVDGVFTDFPDTAVKARKASAAAANE